MSRYYASKEILNKEYDSKLRKETKYENSRIHGMWIETFFINDSVYDLTALTKDNVPFNLSVLEANRRDERNATNTIIYRKVYTYGSRQAIDTVTRDISSIKERVKLGADSELIYNSLSVWVQNNPNVSPYGLTTVTIDKYIPVNDLRETGALYLPDADILFQLGKNEYRILHPHSNSGATDREAIKTIANNGFSGAMVEIVDNDCSIGKRYMYTGNTVVEIQPIKDTTRNNSVNVYTISAGKIIKRETFPIQEAIEKFGLYLTKEEAATGGDPKILRQLELTEKDRILQQSKRELEEAKTANQKLKAEYEQKCLESERAYEELKRDYERRELERKEEYSIREAMRKDYYERRATERKDSSDAWKFATVVGGVILSFGALLLKNSQ